MSEATTEALRAAFLRRLTVDEGNDRRRREFNRAIFFPAGEEFADGMAIFNETDLDMVMAAFDAAVEDLRRGL